MQINRISNISFGKIILNCEEPVPASLLFNAQSALNEHRPNNNFNPISFLDGSLIKQVIECDYNTPQLKARYKQLVEEQEKNPHDIHLDLYLADEGEIPLYPEGWYQKATVGNKVFKQRIYAYEGAVMDFLEDACKYANKLWKPNILPEVVKKSPHKNTFISKILSIFK